MQGNTANSANDFLGGNDAANDIFLLRWIANLTLLNPCASCAQGNTSMAAIAKVRPHASAVPKARRAVTKERLVAVLAHQHHLSKRAGQEMLNDLIGLITKHLRKGERVKITGLGVLQVRDRPASMGRNPMTGEALEIKAGKKVAFRATKKLKLAI